MKNYFERSMTFSEYVSLIDRLLAEGKTTGPNQSEAMVGYGRLNRQRMSRLEKTLVVDDEARALIGSNTRPQIWLILTEGWCGDAAQNIPAIEKAATASDLIETRYLLRDENFGLMDQYLTNGARSIPKLIALDRETLEVLFTWGARPQAAQDLFNRRKAEGVEKPLITEELQRWYNADHGMSVQREVAALVERSQIATVAATTT
ncbi:MAG: thioredoxin family protein [Acidobacteria bacterium]|nr:thioredoxin family protein [Acidobacteriota bacterium]